ncbi:MAG: hypothetical protein SFY69_01425 [Planctomycetota bacterium]|nr:hypothetical protein [Planctomycetota bacterium]
MRTLFLGLTVLFAGLAHAQTPCPTGFVNDSGFIGAGEVAPMSTVAPRTDASVRWDPDGPGPQPELLVVAGSFGSMDGVPARGVAAWDGRTWRALGAGLGTGIGTTDGVFALAVHNGDLYAGGRFTVNNDSQHVLQVARYDGTSWSTVGALFGGSAITSLASHDGTLYAGGDFTVSGQQGADFARLSGSAWLTTSFSTVGPGASNSRVEAMTIYNGSLVVAGSFPYRVATFNGIGFNPLPPPVSCPFQCNGSITALLAEGEDLYVAGDFRLFQTNEQPGVMKFDGATWTPLQTTLPASARSIARYQGFLYLFTGSSNANAAILRRSGNEWFPVGPARWYGPAILTIRALGEYNGQLILGGNFGPADLNNQQNFRYVRAIAQFDGTDVVPLSRGVNARVTSMIAWDNGSVLGVGRFPSAGSQPAGYIGLRSEDGFWTPFAPGLNAQAWAVCRFQNGFAVGGQFDLAGAVDANKVAYWDGQGWNALGEGLESPPVWLGVVNGELWAATAETLSTGFFNGLFAWNGTSWRSLPIPTWSGRIVLVNGEAFTSGVDQFQIPRVYKWDGAAFQAMPLPQAVTRASVLGVFRDTLYAAGGSLVYAWSAGGWELVANMPTNVTGTVGPALAANDDFMYIAADLNNGMFQQVYSWDGRAWAAHGLMPINPRVSWGLQSISARPPSLLATDAGVLVGGAFLYTDQNYAQPQSFIAHLDTSARIRTTSAPEPIVFRGQGESVTLDWQFEGVATSVRWLKDGVQLVDGPLAGVGVISGAATRTLTITGLGPNAAGSYLSYARQTCFETQLSPIMLVVPPDCMTDYNGDGVSDQFDLLYLEQVVGGADNPIGLDPDFNRDGNVDAFDLETLARVIAGEPCPV